jgi:SAM-dependent methyltransferase
MSREIDVLPSYGALVELVGSHIKTLAAGGRLQILEAGCGRSWPFNSLGIEYQLTGVDLDREALEFRKSVSKDLDHAQVGDLRTIALPPNHFHVIYCSYVLEHVQGVERVLANFAKWLRAGGILIISVPDARSVSGFLTRCSPHWFHVLAYRHLMGYPDAGTPGHGPYRTTYERAISANGMQAFAACNDFAMKRVCGIPNGTTNQFSRAFKLLQYASLGTLRADYADITFIMQKRLPATTPPIRSS